MSAQSCASWTEFAASIAKPVCRQAMTSEWSPKIESACVASVRAATCITNGVSSPAILYMFGIMRRRPCDDVVRTVRDRGHGLVGIQREESARHEGLPFSTRPPREPIIESAANPRNDADE